MIDSTPVGRLINTILLAFGEYERNLIIERTSAGKEIVKTKVGFRDGRPKKFKPKQIYHALKMLETHSYREVSELMGISKSTLIRANKK